MEEHFALKAWRLKFLSRSAGRHSEILEYESLTRACRVIVKRLTGGWKTPGDAAATVMREFESLNALRKSLPPPILQTVPEPLMMLPDSPAIVLSKLSGKPMNLVLRMEGNRLLGPMRTRRMTTIGRLTGQWLRALHLATSAEPKPHDSEIFLNALEEKFARFPDLGIAREATDDLKRFTTIVSRQLHGHPVPTSARQGDFTPQNILLDGDRLSVVDFENFCAMDAIYEDVATFVGYIQALSTFPYYSRRALRILADSFLQAYGLAGTETELKLYLLKALIVLISEINLGRGVLFARQRLRLLQAQIGNLCSGLPLTAYAT